MLIRRDRESDRSGVVGGGAVVAGSALVVGSGVAAVVLRVPILSALTEAFCEYGECADLPLALLGWLVSGAPITAVPLIYVWVGSRLARYWCWIVVLAVMAAGLGTVLAARRSPSILEIYPAMTAYSTAALFAYGGLIMGALLAPTIGDLVEERAGGEETWRLGRMLGLAAPQPAALTLALALLLLA